MPFFVNQAIILTWVVRFDRALLPPPLIGRDHQRIQVITLYLQTKWPLQHRRNPGREPTPSNTTALFTTQLSNSCCNARSDILLREYFHHPNGSAWLIWFRSGSGWAPASASLFFSFRLGGVFFIPLIRTRLWEAIYATGYYYNEVFIPAGWDAPNGVCDVNF